MYYVYFNAVSNVLLWETKQEIKQTILWPGEVSSPNEVLVEEEPKNCSLRRDSGTGLTMNLRPAEWTTWAAVLGEMPERKVKRKGQVSRGSRTSLKSITWH